MRARIQKKASVGIIGVMAGIRTDHLPDTSPEHHQYTNLLSKYAVLICSYLTMTFLYKLLLGLLLISDG
jgi:hypothetical protein